jgi:hypothetical protein
MIEVGLDTGEIAAEKLAVRIARPPLRQTVPFARHGPDRWRARSAARREAVYEDLVDDRRRVPDRGTRLRQDPEVVRGRNFMRVHPRAVEPCVAGAAAAEQPTIRGDRIAKRNLCAPPHLALWAGDRCRLDGSRFSVTDVADEDGVGRADGGTQPELYRVAVTLDVELRPVVVGPVQDPPILLRRWATLGAV